MSQVAVITQHCPSLVDNVDVGILNQYTLHAMTLRIGSAMPAQLSNLVPGSPNKSPDAGTTM